MVLHDEVRTPATAKPSPAKRPAEPPTGPKLLDLQRKAGNAAVTALVQRDTPTATAVVWKIPTDLLLPGLSPEASTGDEVHSIISFASLQLQEQANSLDDTAAESLRGMARQMTAEAGKFAGKPTLDAGDPKYLTNYLNMAGQLAQREVAAAVERAVSTLEIPDGKDDGMWQRIQEDLDEKAHQAYISTNQDQLGKVLGMIKKTEEISGQIKEYTSKVQEVTKHLSSLKAVAKVGEMAKSIGELNAKFAAQVAEAKKTVDLIRQIATAAGVDNTSNGTAMMQGVNAFEAGIGLVDKVIGSSLGKAVPVFGDLWNKWYKPMVDACIKSLKIIAGTDERQGRELIVVNFLTRGEKMPNGAPKLGKYEESQNYFPGGQQVLTYLYGVRSGNRVPLDDATKKFFLARTDIFNVNEKTDQLHDGEWHLFSANKQDNVSGWIAAHIDKVWAMLYGDLGRYIN
jgi:hypothetical protein